MSDFKELREALDRHAAVADPARLGEAAHIQYCRDAGVIQSWCRVDRLRVLLDRLEAAERDAEGSPKMPNKMPLPHQSACDIEYSSGFDMGYAQGWNEAIDSMKEQQP